MRISRGYKGGEDKKEIMLLRVLSNFEIKSETSKGIFKDVVHVDKE